jgi:hypothetical protein
LPSEATATNEGATRRPANRSSIASWRDNHKIESTVRYLGIEVDDALAIAEQVDVRITGAKPTGFAPFLIVAHVPEPDLYYRASRMTDRLD